MEGERKCNVSLKKNVERVYGMPIKDVLIEYYIKKDMSMYELAEELNVAVGTVFKGKRYSKNQIRLRRK